MKRIALALLASTFLMSTASCQGKEPELGDICVVLGIVSCAVDPATRSKIGAICDGNVFQLLVDDCEECSHIIGSEVSVACKGRNGQQGYTPYAKLGSRCEKAGAGACNDANTQVLTCSANGTWTLSQTCKCGMTPSNAVGCI
jgi:hypothetical protein